MSAFSPIDSDGNHQAPQTSNNTINEIYPFPYFPTAMINPYFNSSNGYTFSGMGPAQNQMNNMANLHPTANIPQFSSDPFTTRLFPNNANIALYNNQLKNELFEQASMTTVPNGQSINESKSSSNSSIHELVRNGECSSVSPGDENHHTPGRLNKLSKTGPKSDFKSPEEESTYRIRRQKNNEAARMSRIRRQQREKLMNSEIEKLKSEVAYWKNKYNQEIGIYKVNANPVLGEIQNH